MLFKSFHGTQVYNYIINTFQDIICPDMCTKLMQDTIALHKNNKTRHFILSELLSRRFIPKTFLMLFSWHFASNLTYRYIQTTNPLTMFTIGIALSP